MYVLFDCAKVAQLNRRKRATSCGRPAIVVTRCVGSCL